jgi:hypothetical protein
MKAGKKKCNCNCHDADMRRVMDMKEHKNCRECRKALREEREWLRNQECLLENTEKQFPRFTKGTK